MLSLKWTLVKRESACNTCFVLKIHGLIILLRQVCHHVIQGRRLDLEYVRSEQILRICGNLLTHLQTPRHVNSAIIKMMIKILNVTFKTFQSSLNQTSSSFQHQAVIIHDIESSKCNNAYKCTICSEKLSEASTKNFTIFRGC